MTRLLFVLVLSTVWGTLSATAFAQNTPPVAVNDTTTVEDGVLVTLDVLANDTDPDDDPLSLIALPLPPEQGDAVILTTESGQFIQYRSDEDAVGLDSLVYRISDGAGGDAVATVLITIIQNDPPTPQADTVAVFAHEVVDIDVLANDTDPDDDPLTLTGLPATPSHGTAQIVTAAGLQQVRYNPDDTYEGRDSLRYEVADTLGHTATAVVRIEVIRNQPPVAVNDSLTMLVDTTVVIDVLANDTDAEDDTLFIQGIAEQPTSGSVEILEGRTQIRYTPTPGFLGEDRFDYVVSDGVPRETAPLSDRGTVIVQVLPFDDSFEAVLSGANVVPATETRASGLIRAVLDGTTLSFSGVFSGLESAVPAGDGALVRIGSVGRNGDLLFPLTLTLNPDQRSGTLSPGTNTFTVSAETLAALFERRLYVTIVTASGEKLRGQFLPAGSLAMGRAALSGRAVIPATTSRATGGIMAERFGNTLILTGAFSGLSAPLTQVNNARLHQGIIGGNGDVLFDLQVTPDADRRGGILESQNNQFPLTPEQVQLFDQGLTYVTIHTQNAAGGELRGQLLPFSKRVFEVSLAGANETPPVRSTGGGGLLVTVDGPVLTLSGTFRDLTSEVDLTIRNGGHIHQAAPDQNGPILFELVPLLTADRKNGSFVDGANQFTLGPDQLVDLFAGNLYVNLHTETYPTGEIRGHILPSPNVAPSASPVVSPADGAVEDLAGDAENPFPITWQAATDPNGNTVFYRWQLALDDAFNAMVFTTGSTTETRWTTTFGALNGALDAAGVDLDEQVMLHHRVVTTDGGLSTAGPASRITLTRGTSTDAEDQATLPKHFAVHGNYPNPFNPTTAIRLDVPQAARVHVEIYDVLGRRRLTTPEHPLEAGAHRAVPVDASSLASGLYLYRVVARTETRTFTGTGRMMVVK